ncbi:hypothetical protein [Plantactinospora sp. GCM10030261]|uniref:hypothetical protein n=1 Tax=Plantactinospora sp. GCM10030261 TaxID=3273420 RepID=UPI00361494A2
MPPDAARGPQGTGAILAAPRQRQGPRPSRHRAPAEPPACPQALGALTLFVVTAAYDGDEREAERGVYEPDRTLLVRVGVRSGNERATQHLTGDVIVADNLAPGHGEPTPQR